MPPIAGVGEIVDASGLSGCSLVYLLDFLLEARFSDLVEPVWQNDCFVVDELWPQALATIEQPLHRYSSFPLHPPINETMPIVSFLEAKVSEEVPAGVIRGHRQASEPIEREEVVEAQLSTQPHVARRCLRRAS